MTWVRKLALHSLTLLALPGAANAQLVIVPDTSRVVTAGGKATVVTSPDMATVSLGVYVLDRNLRSAKGASDKSVKGLLQMVADLGIAPEDISSAAVNIEPKYTEDKQPVFQGFEVSRTIEVTLRDLAKLDMLIDQSIQAGANRNFAVTLQSSHEKELREKALAMAIEDARSEAARLAAGFGVTLGPVRSIRPSLDSSRTMASGATISYGQGTFMPGTIRVEAEVSVTFLLDPSSP
ncbi:MAG TPA: SIMPL domain-containing protein [Thermoanaerobaculia bacterium]|nr:SIMPL domain-containing protein [Thermoanaerobaculia bacterium]